MTELVRIAALGILGSQGAYFVTIFLLGRLMIDWYEWGYFFNTNNWFLKIANGFTATFFGIAYWAGKRVDHHNWFLKRIYLMGYLFVYIIIAMIAYDILDYFLNVIDGFIYT
ncbi:hypothetical protein ACFFIX_14795 [Metabacillus herbersteinensis]|uniref:Uncharacterized protein n=1 Tax=Metabacillus herbersteinensis TaxID=283816 RepID=A0ABV6GG91_9BACI